MVGVEKFLDHALFCHMSDTPIFGQMEDLMEIHHPGKFHWYNICGCQVIYFQSFLYKQKVGFVADFGWFLVDYKAKSSPMCTKRSSVMQCKAKYRIGYRF